MCLSSSKMRKCRRLLCRWQHHLTKNFPILLKVGLFFLACSSLLLPYLYYRELSSKTKLIGLALGSGSVEDMVKPDNDTLILNGLLKKEKNPFVLIAVTSLPNNYYRRNIIRSTWAKDAYENYGAAVVFFTGKPYSDNHDDQMANLIKESKQFGDLIIDDFEESYYALSIKTLRLFKYFKFHHPKSKFLVKTDDDVFVNVQNLVHYCYVQNHEFEKKYRETLTEMENSDDENNDQEIQQLSPPPPQKRFHYLGGVIHGDRGAHTWNTFSKWFAPRPVWRAVFETVNELKVKGSNITVTDKSMESLNENSYPSYAEGNFYVLSDDAVKDILKISLQLPLYHLEDVYVTGVLATWMLGIEKDNMPFVSSASNFFPKLSYIWYKIFDTGPDELIAFHCDNSVDLISTIYNDSNLITK